MFLFLSALALATAPPPSETSAQPLSTGTIFGGIEPQPSEMAAARLVFEAMQSDDLTKQMALFDRALAMVPRPTRFRGVILCTKAELYTRKESYAEARNPAEECLRLLPDEAAAQSLAGMVRAETGDLRGGTALLIAALRKAPTLLQQLDISALERHLRILDYARETKLRDDLLLQLGEARVGQSNPAFFGRVLEQAVATHVAAKRREQAAALLPLILDPDVGLKMLIDRRYELIWPEAELWADGTLERQRDVRLASTKAAFEADPSLDNRLTLADALARSGKRDAAIVLLNEAIGDEKLWDDERFDISTAATRLARYLHAEGRGAEGFAMVRRMMAANPIATYPYAANLVPNFAQALVGAGEYQQALDIIALAKPDRTTVEHEAALGYYVAIKSCALHGLDRRSEAEDQRRLLETRYAANQQAARIVEGCVADDAAQIRAKWLAQIKSEETRAATLLYIHRIMVGYKPPELSAEEHAVRVAVTRDKDISTAFLKYGRRLPRTFDPALNVWRPGTDARSSPKG